MQAIKIITAGTSFLLPASHGDNYEFLSYIIEHKEQIAACVTAYKQWLKAPLGDMPPVPDMKEFKQKTGIIGAPFNLHDVDLYVLNNDVDVVLELEI